MEKSGREKYKRGVGESEMNKKSEWVGKHSMCKQAVKCKLLVLAMGTTLTTEHPK